MRRVRGFCAILWGACGAGCFSANPSAPDSFVCQTTRNTVEAPLRDHDEVKFIKVLHKEAEKYWAQTQGTSGTCFTEPYHDGFVEGFVNYIQAGGSGEPPYLPPFRYRLTNSRTPEGVARVEDWYAGFRHGAAIAKSSGLRELTYVPLPGPATPKDPNLLNWADAHAPTSSAPPKPGELSPWDQPGQLPQPRPVTPDKDVIPPVQQSQSSPAPLAIPRVPPVPPEFSTTPRVTDSPQYTGLPLIPVPQIPIQAGFATPVKQADAIVQPVRTKPASETDPWHPATPQSPCPASGTH